MVDAIGMAAFALGSIACALSANAAALIAFRAVQGAGGAAMLGTVVAVRESRDPRPRRLDVAGVATSAAGLVGATLGLIESASHGWDSWPVAAPLAIGAAFLVGFALWERRSPPAASPPRRGSSR